MVNATRHLAYRYDLQQACKKVSNVLSFLTAVATNILALGFEANNIDMVATRGDTAVLS